MSSMYPPGAWVMVCAWNVMHYRTTGISFEIPSRYPSDETWSSLGISHYRTLGISFDIPTMYPSGDEIYHVQCILHGKYFHPYWCWAIAISSWRTVHLQNLIMVTWLLNVFGYNLQCTQTKTLEINARTNKQHWGIWKVSEWYSSTFNKLNRNEMCTLWLENITLPNCNRFTTNVFGWNLNQEAEKRITSWAVPLNVKVWTAK